MKEIDLILNKIRKDSKGFKYPQVLCNFDACLSQKRWQKMHAVFTSPISDVKYLAMVRNEENLQFKAGGCLMLV